MKEQTLCLCQCLVPYISLIDKTQNFGTKALMSEQKAHTHHKIKGKIPDFTCQLKPLSLTQMLTKPFNLLM